MKFDRRELLYVPNLITIFRFLFMPLPIWFISRGHYHIALGLVVFGMATDILDGYLARKLKQVSELGKILDPLSDKLAIGALVIALVVYRGFPLWAAVLIIARDLIILLGSITIMTRRSILPMSNLLGKLAAITWGALVLSYLTDYDLMRRIFLYLAVAMAVLSFVVYASKAKSTLGKNSQPNS